MSDICRVSDPDPHWIRSFGDPGSESGTFEIQIQSPVIQLEIQKLRKILKLFVTFLKERRLTLCKKITFFSYI